jgi:hypothetical protein
MNTGFKDIEGNDIREGDKMFNTLSPGNHTYEVKSYEGKWWLFDDSSPYMMLIPGFNSNRIAQYKVVKQKSPEA